MDNQEQFTQNAPGRLKGLLTRRNIFIVFIMVVGFELIWGYSNLFGPNIFTNKTTPEPKLTTMSLIPFNNTVKVGEKITVGVSLLSNKSVDGFDVIVSYDPALLSVEATGSAKPFLAGSLFNDYPQNLLDKDLGKITVSGISNQPVTPNGFLGSVIFIAKAPGLAKISLDFTPLSTTDTNVTETKTGNDILDKVENVELNILP